MIPHIRGKKVLFITTKNLDYIRNTQERVLLEEQALSFDVIGSRHKSYFFRLLCVYGRLAATRMSFYDTVFIGFAPQLVLPFWGWKFRKTDVVIDFFISLYDTLCCDRKKVDEKNVLGRLLHKIDEVTLRQAKVVICDTKAHGCFFSEEFGVDQDKLYTMYLQADKAIYDPRKVDRPDDLKDKFIVLYFGSVLPLQGVDVVLKAMNILKREKDIHCVFIGPVEDKKLKELIAGAKHIEHMEWLPQERLAEYIAMSDLCLAGHFCNDIQKAKRTIPGKAYIYQAMGKPMILGDNVANRELFTEDDKTYFVEMGNVRALVDVILKCSKNKGE